MSLSQTQLAEVFSPIDPNALRVEAKDLSGRTAIVTGANSGIGFAIARDLLKMRAHVVLEKAVATHASLAQLVPGANISVMTVDVSSLASCRAFAAAWTGGPIDFLIHNAGIVSVRKGASIDGHEANYATNFLGPFLLTLELLPFIADHGRIILNTSISLWDVKPLDPDDLGALDILGKKSDGDEYSVGVAMTVYGRSKACGALFAQELARRFARAHRPIYIHAVHPGVVRTSLWQKSWYPTSGELSKRLKIVAANGCSADQGADAIVNMVVCAQGGNPALNGSAWNRQNVKAPPTWFTERERVDALIARFERDAGVKISDALGRSKL